MGWGAEQRWRQPAEAGAVEAASCYQQHPLELQRHEKSGSRVGAAEGRELQPSELSSCQSPRWMSEAELIESAA